jgi:hypothetical protein
MSYASGGLIQASDYNGFVGTNSTTSGTVNYIWSTGNGQYGYGQTALASVSSTGLVTATQWASVINTLNSIYVHQTGSGTGLSAPTAGSLITYLSAVSGSVSTINTNHISFASQGSTTTGTTYSPNFVVANTNSSETYTVTRTVTFASGDAARYFFNAGGQINFVIASVTNGDSSSRSGDLVTLLATDFASLPAFRATTNGGRSGSGGTLNTNATSIGYYGLTTSPQTLVSITSTTSGYTGDYVTLTAQTNTTNYNGNGDVGYVITFVLTIFSATRPTLPAPPANPPGTGTTTTNTSSNDSINITVNHHVDIVAPETTNLSNTWGTITVA